MLRQAYTFGLHDDCRGEQLLLPGSAYPLRRNRARPARVGAAGSPSLTCIVYVLRLYERLFSSTGRRLRSKAFDGSVESAVSARS